VLKRLERVLCLLITGEGVAGQEAGEWRRDEAEVADELPVVSCEPQESAKTSGGVRLRPSRDRLNLVRIHGDPRFRDDVAQVGHRRRPERALRALKV
jgi:hypothetical protein